MDTREKIKAKIAELQAALRTIDWVESQEKAPSASTKTSENGANRRAGGFREARNKGESWAEAVDAVLAGGKAMTIAEIVDALSQQGRVFGESRPDATVRSVIIRRGKSLGWNTIPGSKPKKVKKVPT